MRVRDAAPSHTAFGIEFIANTGVRPGPSELLSLQWKHVDWKKSSIKVFAEKTQRWRTIPVKADFLDKLLDQKQKAKSKYIIEYNGRKVKSLHQAFRRVCERANVGKRVVLYDIRHWYCTTLLSKGVSVKTVATLIGHSSAKLTLDIYSHFIPGDADKAITVLPDLG